jgi:chitinase
VKHLTSIVPLASGEPGHTMEKLIGIIFLAVFLLTACTTTPEPENSESTEMPKPVFRVIGYTTDANIPELIPYDKLTHINYAFLIPNDDGTLAGFANAWKLDKIVELAHKNNCKVLISVGGWGWDREFETLAANAETRTLFVDALAGFAADHNLDGVDMDWEFPDPGDSAQNFLAIMTELRAAIPKDKLLSAAVVAYGDTNGLGIPEEAFALMDFVNIMAYDGPDHGSMSQAENALDYWLGRGLPPEKAVLGVPFYEHPNYTPYRKLVEANPEAANTDTTDYYGANVTYNGIPTIQAKTRLAQERASGIMFWTLESDAQGELSLIGAIDAVLHGEE